MKNKVFLGGTCNSSKWRESLIPKLKIEYFNPVVEDWTPECQLEEIRQKNEECYWQLYVITPKMTGVFSIAEVVDSSNKLPSRTIFCITKELDDNDFSKAELKSLEAVQSLVKDNGAIICKNIDEIASFLNNSTIINYNK